MDFPDPILVTGVPRSRTSLVAGILDALGTFGGEFVPAGPGNPSGFFENAWIREQVVKPYLKRIGACRRGQSRLPDASHPIEDGWVNRIITMLETQGYTGGPWFVKDCKLALIWRQIAHAFPGGRWLVVRRDTESIARSCLRAPFMQAHDSMIGWQSYIHEYLQRFQDMAEAGLNVTEVDSDQLLDGDWATVRGLCEDAGIPWNHSVAERVLIDRHSA